MIEDYPVRVQAAHRNPDGKMVRHGGCSCGAVRFVLVGEPVKVGICHCSECRKATGGVFVAYADWYAEAFSYSGFVETYKGRSFCPLCGSRLFHLAEDGVEVMLGALDDVPSGLVPTREGWITRREPWLHAVDSAGQYDKDPPREA
jgi:hypothetical protein